MKGIIFKLRGMKINNLNKERKMTIMKITELQGEKPNKKENRKWKRELEEVLRDLDALRQSVNIAEEEK